MHSVLLCALAASVASALPLEQLPFLTETASAFRPSRHWSGISPHFSPSDYPAVPLGCRADLAIYLTRHGAIYANDDEYEETMEPFLAYIKELQAPADKENPFFFLNGFCSLVNSSNLEDPTEPGLRDARELGSVLRGRYPDLFPPIDSDTDRLLGDPFKVWSASSSRDLATARAWMEGAFPDLRSDDERVRLVKVPNKQPDWATSLTPHKVCPRFEKETSLGPAREWLAVYAPRIIERLDKVFPGKLTSDHILAMQMLGAYEASITGSLDNRWTRLFEKEDWLDFEYYFDVRYHYMVGYGSENLTAALGTPFVNTVLHLLETDITDPDHPHLPSLKPSKPERPPNATHTQLLYPYFTHREEPTTLAVALGLFNETMATWTPSLDKRDDERAWRTSEIIPFLGNIAFERLTCSTADDGAHERQDEEETFIRVLVNHVAHRLPGCQDGRDGTCTIGRFREWVEERNQIWGDFETACKKE